MGLSRSDLQRDRKTITYTHVHSEGDESTVTVTFTPSKLTGAVADDIQDRTGDDMHHAVCEILSLVLVDWDVFEDDDQTVRTPTTYESLMNFPLHFLLGVYVAAQEVNQPGGSKPSAAG